MGRCWRQRQRVCRAPATDGHPDRAARAAAAAPGRGAAAGAAAGAEHAAEDAAGADHPVGGEPVGAGKRSTVPSLISISISVRQFAAVDEHSEKCTISFQLAFQSSILRWSK